MVANPTWDPNGAWVNVMDDGDPWTAIPAHWEQGWFAASGISAPVNSTSPLNNSANISISGGLLNLTVGNIAGTPYGALINTNPSNSPTATGFTLTPPYAVEAQLTLPGPGGGAQVPNWCAWWSDGQNWPDNGEVDPLESLGVPDWNSFHVHDAVNPDGIGGTSNLSPPYGLHTFGYYRSASLVQFYYDGALVGTEPIATASPHYLILVMTYNGTPDVLPTTMQVGFVRAWTPGTAPTTGMTVTATAAGAGADVGLELSVLALTGASTTQAGATVHDEALATPELTLTPASSGSLVVGSLLYGAGTKFTQDTQTTFLQNNGDGVTRTAYAAFRAASPTTAGHAVTTGATGPANSGTLMYGAAAEIQAAAGQSIVIDPSSPAAAFQNTGLVTTTDPFSPPGGSILVAIAGGNYTTPGTASTMAISDTSGLTWTQLTGNATQDLCSVWVAGTGASPVPGPPAVSRQLAVSVAPQSGTDAFGNAFPQGIQVGTTQGPQVALLPTSPAARIQFPAPAPLLSNTANISAGAVAALAELILSGPALAAAGDKDWVQIVFFANDGSGAAAHMEFRYINNAQSPTTVASYNSAGWSFGGGTPLPVAGVSAAIATLPTDTNSGTTWVSGERTFMNNNWVSNINSNFSAIITALKNANIIT